MRKIYGNCCGIDIHKRILVAHRIHGKQHETREYGVTTSEVLSFVDWLIEGKCEMVAMESTGSYWKPIYNLIEAHGLPVTIVNAQHMKAVPGRKTDVKDAEWIADLLQHGLLNSSFIPCRQQRELRETAMLRRKLIQNAASMVNRIQKLLEGANIKLGNVVADIMGKSARNLLTILIEGERIDENKLDEMREKKLISKRLNATTGEILEALNGFMTPAQRRNLRIMFEAWDDEMRHVHELDKAMVSDMTEEQSEAAEMIREVGGIAERSSQEIIAACGTDMSIFPTMNHFTSWLGLCPGNNESARKRKSGKTRKGIPLGRVTLIQCAHSAVKVKGSFFSARFEKIAKRRGRKRAYVAVAHSMAKAIYCILKHGIRYKDLGSKYYNQFNREQKLNSILKRARDLGYEVTAVDKCPEIAS